jgi:hypothetical protein
MAHGIHIHVQCPHWGISLTTPEPQIDHFESVSEPGFPRVVLAPVGCKGCPHACGAQTGTGVEWTRGPQALRPGIFAFHPSQSLPHFNRAASPVKE